MWWNNERIINIIINCVIKNNSQNVQMIVIQTADQILLSGSSSAVCIIISLIYFGVFPRIRITLGLHVLNKMSMNTSNKF